MKTNELFRGYGDELISLYGEGIVYLNRFKVTWTTQEPVIDADGDYEYNTDNEIVLEDVENVMYYPT